MSVTTQLCHHSAGQYVHGLCGYIKVKPYLPKKQPLDWPTGCSFRLLPTNVAKAGASAYLRGHPGSLLSQLFTSQRQSVGRVPDRCRGLG